MAQETVVIIRDETDEVIPVIEQTTDKVAWISQSDKDKLDSLPASGQYYSKSEIDLLLSEASAIQ